MQTSSPRVADSRPSRSVWNGLLGSLPGLLTSSRMWREKIRSELLQRRRELTDELREVDDLLGQVGGGSEPTFADRNGQPAAARGGRPPGPETRAVEEWLRGYSAKMPERVVSVNKAFGQAVSEGIVEDRRPGREKIR